MKEHDMTHMNIRPDEWRAWFGEAGIVYVEVETCPDEACETCRAEPEVAAAA